MSGRLQEHARLLDLPRRERDVLTALAAHARDDGTSAHPGNGLLAVECDLSVAQIKRYLVRLRERGLIVAVAHEHGGRSRGFGFAVEYFIALDHAEFRANIPEHIAQTYRNGHRVESLRPTPLRQRESAQRERQTIAQDDPRVVAVEAEIRKLGLEPHTTDEDRRAICANTDPPPAIAECFGALAHAEWGDSFQRGSFSITNAIKWLGPFQARDAQTAWIAGAMGDDPSRRPVKHHSNGRTYTDDDDDRTPTGRYIDKSVASLGFKSTVL